MEKWICTLYGFSEAEQTFLQEVVQSKEGWIKMKKHIVLQANDSEDLHFILTNQNQSLSLSKKEKLRRCTIVKTPESVMNNLFGSRKDLRGLSVTNMQTHVVYIHEKNWNHIPASSEYLTLQAYREALINHELAHIFGHRHVSCPKAGLPSDVRQQPSKHLGGCLPTTSVHLH
jgi:hypothetical protein